MHFSKLAMLPAAEAAPLLLGWQLIYDTSAGRLAGMIVETEAYTLGDPANHAFRGQTARNKDMFGPAGTAYVYFTYGLHFCLNVVTGPEGVGEAVLIRALEPVEGSEIMMKNRNSSDLLNLCSGPAKLCQAYGLNLSHSGHDLSTPPLLIQPLRRIVASEVITTTRIGIRAGADAPLRFYLKESPFISKKAAKGSATG